jgi:translation initiation factor 3 subunit H
MAATLAATIPAPQTAPTPAPPTYEAIPASMSKVIDVEAEIPLSCVQLDGLVRLWFRTCDTVVDVRSCRLWQK